MNPQRGVPCSGSDERQGVDHQLALVIVLAECSCGQILHGDSIEEAISEHQLHVTVTT